MNPSPHYKAEVERSAFNFRTGLFVLFFAAVCMTIAASAAILIDNYAQFRVEQSQ